jgi:hypothetical protein
MRTMRGRVDDLGITAEATLTDRNPHMDDMPEGSTHWLVRIEYDGRTMDVPYSMGPAHSGEPDLLDVLDALASDASSYDNAGSFEDWADEYGYDTDSRKAERTYRAVESQTRHLRHLLGGQYDAIVWDTERR